jgi:hypothetical protein
MPPAEARLQLQAGVAQAPPGAAPGPGRAPEEPELRDPVQWTCRGSCALRAVELLRRPAAPIVSDELALAMAGSAALERFGGYYDSWEREHGPGGHSYFAGRARVLDEMVAEAAAALARAREGGGVQVVSIGGAAGRWGEGLWAGPLSLNKGRQERFEGRSATQSPHASILNGARLPKPPGAGMDTRPWRLRLPPGAAWFDVDQAPVLALKATLLRGARAQLPPNCCAGGPDLDGSSSGSGSGEGGGGSEGGGEGRGEGGGYVGPFPLLCKTYRQVGCRGWESPPPSLVPLHPMHARHAAAPPQLTRPPPSPLPPRPPPRAGSQTPRSGPAAATGRRGEPRREERRRAAGAWRRRRGARPASRGVSRAWQGAAQARVRSADREGPRGVVQGETAGWGKLQRGPRAVGDPSERNILRAGHPRRPGGVRRPGRDSAGPSPPGADRHPDWMGQCVRAGGRSARCWRGGVGTRGPVPTRQAITMQGKGRTACIAWARGWAGEARRSGARAKRPALARAARAGRGRSGVAARTQVSCAERGWGGWRGRGQGVAWLAFGPRVLLSCAPLRRRRCCAAAASAGTGRAAGG